MKHSVLLFLLNCFQIYHVYSSSLPGPLVYVVTPSSKSLQWKDEARTRPFYYSNWIKRMDSPSSSTPITTPEGSKTSDLIFAEFESDNNNMKSIRKLLEKEKLDIQSTTTTTSQPIYVPDEDPVSETDSGLFQSSSEEPKKVDMTDYFALYNNLYNTGSVYVPSTPPTVVPPSSASAPINTMTTTLAPMGNVENIWHIIDSEKHDEYSNKWQETTIDSDHIDNDQNKKETSNENQNDNENGIDDNFALPGFVTNPGNDGENESRAIRTESNNRFPYINLKPFIMKNMKTQKANNMFNLDSFKEIKNPVRGEVQDNTMVPIRQPIDRYNPAQPYLPDYGTKSKTKPSAPPSASVVPVSVPQSPPIRAVANLIPPPPPPPPKFTADDFPTPTMYESFPPYAPNGPGSGSMFSFPTSDPGLDSSANDDNGSPSGPPSGLGYRYRPPTPNSPPAPAPQSPSFVPTLPPLSKPFLGYSYNKPPIAQDDSPPAMDMDVKPDFQGYHYGKPILGFSYDKPASTQEDSPPTKNSQDKPVFQGYSKPTPALEPPPEDHHSSSYGQHDAPPPSYQPETDYPELIYDKPHGGVGDIKGGDGMKANDIGMMPPPPPSNDNKPDSYGLPMDDHGFPHDFPGDFKYAHDFDDHDYHHHHHTTTTTTTEMPRVNRYSYYYLGKKLYYLPLYFSVYFVIYVGALIIKAVLRHKITYPNSFRPGSDTTASFFSKRSIESHLKNENLHEITGRVTKAIATAAEKYMYDKSKDK